MSRVHAASAIAMLFGLCVSSLTCVCAQSTTLKVIGSDGVPIPFAWVSVNGASARIADENGTVSFGFAEHETLALDVRRIGYRPWVGKLELRDTARVLTVELTPIAQQLPGVTIAVRGVASRLELAGFYDRWLQRQKGLLSATFIGPEEIEKRHPSRTTDMLYGLNGLVMIHGEHGAVCAAGNNGACFMTVLLDGSVLRGAGRGCSMRSMFGARQAGGPDLNDYVDPADLAGVEIYARGGNLPITLQGVDNACGVIAIWTGSRR